MDLSSLSFIFVFLLVVLAVYYLIKNRLYRNIVLCLFSLIFCCWDNPSQCLVMIGAIIINYLAGLLLNRWTDRPGRKKAVLVLALLFNILTLASIKYTAFFLNNIKLVIPAFASVKVPSIVQPLGISFYTFQNMSYIIDVYRGDVRAQKNPLLYGTYLSMFPKLISGPIVRYRDVALELTERHENLGLFASGVRLFAVGLAKKMLLANQLAQFWEHIKANPLQSGALGAWLGIIAFSLQLYLDFSGYSDMAIGVARMFGFNFKPNFNYPYISKSVSEFWRRWHISLSSWFRDYVYIPLGGNRRGLPRQLLNLMIVWSLTGLWHGASWNFVFWGMFLGLIIMLEKLFLLKTLDRLPAFVRHIYALILIVFSWSIFNITDLPALGEFIGALFSTKAGLISHDALVYTVSYLPILVISCVASTPLGKNIYDKLKDRRGFAAVEVILILLVLTLCTASAIAGGYQPVLYRQF